MYGCPFASCATYKCVPYALHMLTHSVLSIGLWNRYYYPHVTDEDTKIYKRETLEGLLKIHQDMELVFESGFACLSSRVFSTVVYIPQGIPQYLSSFIWRRGPFRFVRSVCLEEIEVYSNVFMNSRRGWFWMVNFYVSIALSIELCT